MPYNTFIHTEIKRMRIPIKAITVTYTRTLTFTPTTEMFETWHIEPSQEKFEEYIGLGKLVDTIYEDLIEDRDIIPYTVIQQGETVEIDWENEE